MSSLATSASAVPSIGAPNGASATSAAKPSSESCAMPSRERFTLVADDGRHLAASWFEPPSGPARAVAVIHSATGVPHGYYRAFAQWLAEQGYAVLTYDYRGIAGSRRGLIRDERATMRDWAVLDMSAALAAADARRRTAGVPLLLVGHSFGGNSLAFARGVESADALLLVASQIPVVRLFPGIHKVAAWIFFNAWVPAVARLAGHLPAWANGGGEPLPRGVALQWCDWGTREAWAFSDDAMQPHRASAAVVAPVHLWNLSDDLTYAPPGAVDALAAQFRNAAVQRHTATPAELQLPRLGHFGAFRRDAGPRLWHRWLSAIEQAAPRLAPLPAR